MNVSFKKHESCTDLINNVIFYFIVSLPKPPPKTKPSNKKWKGVFKPTCSKNGKPPTNACIKGHICKYCCSATPTGKPFPDKKSKANVFSNRNGTLLGSESKLKKILRLL